MRIRYTETALVEIDDIFAYIAERNRSAAFAVVGRTRDLIAALADFPLMGVVADEAGVRMLPLVRYPYLNLLRRRGERGGDSSRPPCGAPAAVGRAAMTRAP